MKKISESDKQYKRTVSKVKQGKATASKTFIKMVKRVSKLQDIQKLKKTIYNRNYRLRKKYREEHPDEAKKRAIMKFPPIEDLRIVGPATFKRLNKIKDPDQLIHELRKIIVSTTRRRRNPKTTGDYSNKEQDYLSNGVHALQDALASWSDDMLKNKLKGVFDNITMEDINNIFTEVPSYWAISSGFYYAIADFDNFMEEIFDLIERNNVALTKEEKQDMKQRLFDNDPRLFK